MDIYINYKIAKIENGWIVTHENHIIFFPILSHVLDVIETWEIRGLIKALSRAEELRKKLTK